MTIKLIQGDCLEVIPMLDVENIDAVITDPPYPDYHTDKWATTPIAFLDGFKCRQLIFWSAKAQFPLDYTAIHIWDKKTGCGSMYERIFERNGGIAYRVFRHYLINSTVAASYTGDEYTGHPSQKSIALMTELVERYTKPGYIVLDPFMGSGTTGVACVNTGRNFIGIEADTNYFEIAKQRIAEAQMQPRLDGLQSPSPTQKELL